MPLYEYRCKKCNHKFEVLLMVSDGDKSEVATCPKCNSVEIEKIVGSPFSIRFKGKGFYKTDKGK